MQMWPLFYSPDAVKIKQLEEVSYDQIAQL
jgi:hypothetical protein